MAMENSDLDAKVVDPKPQEEPMGAAGESNAKEPATAADRKPKDCYSFIAQGPKDNKTFYLGIFVFLFQILGISLMLASKVLPGYSENEDVDNPDQDGAIVSWSSWSYWRLPMYTYIPANESVLVLFAQVYAAFAFLISYDANLNDVVESFHVLTGWYRKRSDPTRWYPTRKDTKNGRYLIISCILRLLQGTMASVAALILVLTSMTVIDIILNFTAITYISQIDENVFESVTKGWLGEDMKEEATSIAKDDKEKDDKDAEHGPQFGAVWSGIAFVFIIFFIIILSVMIRQHDPNVWTTKQFRVQFDETTNLQEYSGCYHTTGKRNEDRRIDYTADDVGLNNATFSYCRSSKRWFFLKDDSDPCDNVDSELAHSSKTTTFDIATSFEISWFSPYDSPLQMYFIEESNEESDSLFCDAVSGDGKCDDDLNNFVYQYDGGDCCATTCTSFGNNTCGVADDDFAFPNCTDDKMVNISIKLETFEYTTVDDNKTMDDDLFKTINSSSIDSEEWKDFWRNQYPIDHRLELVCNKKKTFSVRINQDLRNFNEEALVSKGANCSVVVNTFEPIFNITTTTSYPRESGIIVETSFRNSIPSAIGKLTDLSTDFFGLVLSDNRLEGGIPTEIGSLGDGIEVLEFDNNILTSTIPSELGDLGNLKRLDLSYNMISGVIPSEIGMTTKLTYLDLSYNRISGTIPSEIGMTTKLTYLDLKSNKLTGSIPKAIGKLIHLEELDLSGNELIGEIPSEEIELLTNLKYLNLAFDGNVNLCGSINCTKFANLTEGDCAGIKNIKSCDTLSPTESVSPSSSPTKSALPTASPTSFPTESGSPIAPPTVPPLIDANITVTIPTKIVSSSPSESVSPTSSLTKSALPTASPTSFPTESGSPIAPPTVPPLIDANSTVTIPTKIVSSSPSESVSPTSSLTKSALPTASPTSFPTESGSPIAPPTVPPSIDVNANITIPSKIVSSSPSTSPSTSSVSPTYNSSVYNILCNRSELKEICRIARNNNLQDSLSMWTIFAFTDAALESLRQNYTNISESVEWQILQYHVVDDQRLLKKDMLCRRTIKSMYNQQDSRTKCDEAGEPIGQKGPSNTDTVPINTFDLEAANGVVHIIDGVLLYKNFEGDE